MEQRPRDASPRPPIAVDGSKIRTLRKDRGIEIADFARMVGCSRAHMANIELGKRPRVSVNTFDGICAALQLAPQHRWRIKASRPAPLAREVTDEPAAAVA